MRYIRETIIPSAARGKEEHWRIVEVLRGKSRRPVVYARHVGEKYQLCELRAARTENGKTIYEITNVNYRPLRQWVQEFGSEHSRHEIYEVLEAITDESRLQPFVALSSTKACITEITKAFGHMGQSFNRLGTALLRVVKGSEDE